MKSPAQARLIRTVYILLFLVIMLAGIYYIVAYIPAVRETGSLSPAGAQVVPQREDGETVYITAKQELAVNLYGGSFALMLLGWLMLGILIEFRFKIQIFRGIPASLPSKMEGNPPSESRS